MTGALYTIASAVERPFATFNKWSIACSALHTCMTTGFQPRSHPSHSNTRRTAFSSTSVAARYQVDESTTRRTFIGVVSRHLDLCIITFNFGEVKQNSRHELLLGEDHQSCVLCNRWQTMSWNMRQMSEIRELQVRQNLPDDLKHSCPHLALQLLQPT